MAPQKATQSPGTSPDPLRAELELRAARIRELEQHAANLEKTRAHHEGHISNLEQHAANLQELRAQQERRIGELQLHASNLEREWARSRERVDSLELHAGNLALELEKRGRRVDELTRHAANLEELLQVGHDRLVPGYRSRFGGLWIDRNDALERIEAKRAAGELGAEEVELLLRWREEGVVVLPGALRPADARRLAEAVDASFRSGRQDLFAESFEQGRKRVRRVEPGDRGQDVKLLDLHALLDEARPAAFAPAIVRFLGLLFERPPLAFQSLFFRYGTEQPMHQDTAYVVVSSPLEFVGCWVALEDIQPGTGELEYYVGSHRLDDYVWDGRYKSMPADHPDHPRYLAWLHAQAEQAGLERRRFLPRCGDALVWSADIAHGGSLRTRREATRLSLVTHYCPADVEPHYFQSGQRHSGRVAVGSAGFRSHPQRGPASRLAAAGTAPLRRLARWLQS